jgi:hypothetical protein
LRRETHLGRAPGLLDIMGGNDDYTDGLVFEATIREATWAAVSLRDVSDAELFANRSGLNANVPESIASEPNKHGAFKNSASLPHRSKFGQTATYPCLMTPAALAPVTPLRFAFNNTHRLQIPFFTAG